MPALPWTSFGATDPTHDYVVMASRLPLARFRDVPAFLRASMDIRRQLKRTDGLIGFGLDANLVRRTFWTLSVWRNADSLDAFARTNPHAAHVKRIRPLMNATTFVTWTTTGDQLPVTWDEARVRINEAA
jgi:heme-degrading monooxygenase HmoA